MLLNCKYYITNKIDIGLANLFSYMTYLYPVISCLIAFYGDKDDEELVTMLMSKCVGNNVTVEYIKKLLWRKKIISENKHIIYFQKSNIENDIIVSA